MKTNIGHLEGAAGLIGVIKATLAIEKAIIPPNMLFEDPNPDIFFDEWKLSVPTSEINWSSISSGPRRASINSFGYGGANAHVILEGYDDVPSTTNTANEFIALNGAAHIEGTRPYLLSFTSHSAKAQELLHSSFSNYLESKQNTCLETLAYTLTEKRTLHRVRSHVVTSQIPDALEQLSGSRPIVTSNPIKRIGFIFTGQGAQSAQMGRQLIEQSPFFRAIIHKADATLQSLPLETRPSWTIFDELSKPEKDSNLGQSRYSQPICTALQLALVDLLKLWNIIPTAVCGHSSGEIAAAYSAGLLSFDSAMVVAYYRGFYMGQNMLAKDAVPGAMMAVGLGEAEAEIELAGYKGRLVIAAVNSPRSVTISGDEDAIVELLDVMSPKVFARKLKVEQAFHSHHMVPLAPAYVHALDSCPLFQESPSSKNMFSSVTGTLANPDGMGSQYWAENMISPVRFADAFKGVVLGQNEGEEPNVDILLEIGPHPALQGPSRQVLGALDLKIPYLGTLYRDKPAFESLLEAAGSLFAHGYPVDLLSTNRDHYLVNGEVRSSSLPKELYDLPSYSWDHKKYWSSTRAIKEYLHRSARHTILGTPVPTSIGSCPRWRNYLRLSEVPWLKEHVFDDKALFPGAGYISMAIEAILRFKVPIEQREVASIHIKDVNIKSPLTLSDSEIGSEVYLELVPSKESSKTVSNVWFDFLIASYDESDKSTYNCTGSISLNFGEIAQLESNLHHPSADELRKSATRRVKPKTLYEQINESGLYLGERFQLIDGDVYCGAGYVVAPVTFKKERYSAHELSEGTTLHPTVLDTCFQSIFYGIETAIGAKLDSVFVPTHIKSLKVSGLFTQPDEQSLESKFTISSQVEVPNNRTSTSNIQFHQSDTNQLVMEIEGLEMTALGNTNSSSKERTLFFRQKWLPCFDLLDQSHASEKVAKFDIFELYQFQHPDARVLVLPAAPDATLKTLQNLIRDPSERRLFQSMDIFEAEDVIEYEQLKKLDGIKLRKELDGTYDLIIMLDPTFDQLLLQQHLKANSVIFTTLETSELSGFESPIELQGLRVHRKPTACPMTGGLAVITGNSDESVTVRTKTMIECLKQAGIQVTTYNASNIPDSGVDQEIIIVLASLDSPIIDSSIWNGLRDILNYDNKTIIWLLQDNSLGYKNPEHAKMSGLLRVARNESLKSRIITLDIETNTTAEFAAQRIAQCLDVNLLEEELTERGGCMYIPRIMEDKPLNRKLPSGVGSEPKVQRFGDAGAVSLKIAKIGLLETLHFSEEEQILYNPLAEDDVEIKVMASALNFRDIAAAMGIIQDYKLGDECAGIVHRIGSAVDPKAFAPGDRVVACRPGQGAHATFVRQPAALCVKIPDSWSSYTLAASFSGVLTTAHYSLLDIGRLQAGEIVLIHSAAGGVGQMAIQIALMQGARVLATCGSESKREILRRRYGIPDCDIFSSRDESFVKGVLGATNGRGADVILNSLAGPLLMATWSCIAPFGRFVEIGKRDIHQNSTLPMAQFRKNVIFASVDLVMIYEKNPKLARRILESCAELFFSGKIQPPEGILEFSYAEAEKAFRLLQKGKHTGKVVLIPNGDDMVLVAPPTLKDRNTSLFDPSKTYLLVGGLGGLGTALTEWMCRHGLKKVAFFSRSGPSTDNAKETIKWLTSKDIEISIFQGDVTNMVDVKSCVEAIGPLIGGIFHAAMALEDSLLHNMTFEQYERCISTKCIGAQNLHEATLSTKLDFFVCFSSSSAIIGNIGQANYSAANAYIDALMGHRRSKSLPGSTMNIGAVSDLGVVNENPDIMASMLRMKIDLINEHEFLHLVEETIKSSHSFETSLDGVNTHQLITGINVKDPDVFWSSRSLFRTLYANREYGNSSDSTHKGKSLKTMLANVTTTKAKVEIIENGFMEKVAAVLGVSLESLSSSSPLAAYGLDSIVAVELTKWFKDTANLDVPLFDIMGAKSIHLMVVKAVGIQSTA